MEIKKERNYGVDALRIVSMLMIVLLHTLGQGGILNNTAYFSSQYYTAWFLEILAFCSTNCYALISGYVGCGSKFRYSKIINLWLQVLFYMLLITGAFSVFYPDTVTGKTWFNAFFPIMTNHYWYVTAYFGMFFLMPVMNMAINSLEKKYLKQFFVAASVIFSLLPCLLGTDPFTMNGGYSMLWLCVLYIVGGYIGKYGLDKTVGKAKAAVGFLLSTVISWGVKMGIGLLKVNHPDFPVNENVLFSYTSPTVFLAAVFLLMFFAGINFKNKAVIKVIALLAPASLGVYIIHVNGLVWAKFITNFAVSFAENGAAVMAGKAILAAAAVYLVCSLIDIARLWLFKALRINVLCQKLGGGIEALIYRE